MANITNYYEKLGLTEEMSLEEISGKLSQIDAVWNQRLLNEPEKAQEMLKYISEAKAVFANTDSRDEYNKELQRDKEPGLIDDGSLKKTEEFKKYAANLKDFCETQQFDMAKTVLEQILPLEQYDPDERHSELYHYAVMTYFSNKLFDQALEISNKAILKDSENLRVYDDKAWALLEYSNDLKNQQGTNSEVFMAQQKSLRSTCELWIKKAEAQSSDEDVAKAKQYLAISYYYCADYGTAEDYAFDAYAYVEGLSEEEKNRFAPVFSILNSIYNDFSAEKEELQKYYNEPLYYWDDIQSFAERILALHSVEGQRFTLATKTHSFLHGHLEDDTLHQNVKDTYTYSIYPDLSFVMDHQQEVENQYHDPGMFNFSPAEHHNSSLQVRYDGDNIDKFLIEFDFTGKWSYFTEWSEMSDNIGWISEHTGDAWLNRGAKYELTRHSRKKGYGLFRFLRDIFEKEQDYLKACQEANEKYNAELTPIRERIIQEYSQKRSVLTDEMQEKVNGATKNDEMIKRLNEQISSMNAEYSNLGLFAGRKKKELQLQIDSARRQLNEMESSDQVIQRYEQLLKKLDSEEKTEIKKAEQDIRGKYPLPQK